MQQFVNNGQSAVSAALAALVVAPDNEAVTLPEILTRVVDILGKAENTLEKQIIFAAYISASFAQETVQVGFVCFSPLFLLKLVC
jgi:hypothetical protein